MRQMVRARWDAGRVRFASADDFDQELRQYLCKGAILLDGADLPPPLEPFAFELCCPGVSQPLPLRGMIVSRSGDASLLQVLDFSAAILDALPRGEAAPPAAEVSRPVGPRQTGVFTTSVPSLTRPLEGELVNPTDLAGLAALPLGAVAAVRDLTRVSTVGLVRYLGTRRATGQLVLRGGGTERRWPLERGAYLLAVHEREAARVAFAWPHGTYQLQPGPVEVGAGRTPVLAWRLVLDAVRARIREAEVEELSRHVSLNTAVRLGAAYLERSRALDLTSQQERMVKRDFDGRRALRDIVRQGQVSEVALLRLVFLFSVLGLVELVPPGGDAAVETDDVREEYERLVSADLFAALGLHWSDAPERLDGALVTMHRRYGPGSPAAARSPEYAGRLVELAERSYRRLRDREERRRYRREVLGVDARHAAELLAAQVPLARARGEDVAEILSAACDLQDDPALERLRRELTAR
jgi:hypothetical protein